MAVRTKSKERVDRGGINQTVVVFQVGVQLITSPFPQVLLLQDLGVVGVDDPSYDVGVSGGGGGRAESADLRTRGGEKELEFFEGVGFWVGERAAGSVHESTSLSREEGSGEPECRKEELIKSFRREVSHPVSERSSKDKRGEPSAVRRMSESLGFSETRMR